jgi:hypothetical protein
VHVLLWGSLAAATVPVLRSPDVGPLATMAGLIVFGLALERFLLGVTIELRRTRLHFGLGDGSLVKSSVALDEISDVESVTYRPLREFGGWGWRGSSRRRAWTAAGNQAVVVHLHDGREIYLGSEHPHRLEQRVRAALPSIKTGS